MNIRFTKNIALMLAGSMLTLAILGAGFLYLKNAFSGFEWSTKTRVMLHEVVSPNKEYKFGVYHYDSGSLGYSAVQASLVKIEDNYPINGNMLTGKSVASVNWLAENTVEIVSPTTSDLKSGFILQIRHE